MATLTSLFIYKLYSTLKLAAQDNDENFQSELTYIMSKISILSGLSIFCTMLSCILLILRYAIMVDNMYVNNISDWVIAIDIYSNFLFITLSMKCYNKWYLKIFGCLHDVIGIHDIMIQRVSRISMNEKQRKAIKQMVIIQDAYNQTSESNSTTSQMEMVNDDNIPKNITNIILTPSSDTNLQFVE